MGKPLPKGAHVHHVNGDKADNRPTNLVVCEDAAYHKLLHVRTEALKACGNANWKKCRFCQRYDDPTSPEMYVQPTTGAASHRSCRQAYRRKRKNIIGEWR